MKRGDIVTIADPSGDFSSKPRPAVIVQNDLFNNTHASVTVCLITSQLTGHAMFRVPLPADNTTGLRRPSEVEVDKIQAVWSHRVGKSVGKVSEMTMLAVDEALKRWLAL